MRYGALMILAACTMPPAADEQQHRVEITCRAVSEHYGMDVCIPVEMAEEPCGNPDLAGCYSPSGYIQIRPDYWDEPGLWAHEYTHVIYGDADHSDPSLWVNGEASTARELIEEVWNLVPDA